MNLECVENMLNIYENTDVHVFYYVFCVKCIKVKINVKRILTLKYHAGHWLKEYIFMIRGATA